MAAAAAVATVLIAYADSFHNGFHFDDTHVIENNLFIRSLANAGRFFTDASTFSTLPDHQTYRPLLSLTYALDYRMGGGLDPVPFHVTQLLLHLLVGAGLFLLFRRIMDEAEPGPVNPWLALFGATWFCVHTANTETVNYLSSRSDVLSTLGIVGAFVAYLYLPRSRRLHLYLIPMAVGALAKLPAVMFAALLPAYALLFEEDLAFTDVLHPRNGKRVGRALLRAAPAIVVGGALFFFVQGMNGAAQTYGGGSRWAYLRTEPWAWLHYLRLFVLPVGLTADTDWTLIPHWYDPRVIAGVVAAALLAWAAVRASRERAWRPVAFGLVWFAVGLIPSSTVFPLAEVVNEHRLYLPMAGLVLAACWTAMRLAKRRRPAGAGIPRGWVAAGMVLLAANVVGTSVRNRVWRTDETLWSDVVTKSPGDGRAWMNYGLAQMEVGDYAHAVDNFRKAATLWPRYPPVQVNLGIATFHLGDTTGADAHFREALALDPGYAPAHFFYGRYLVQVGRGPEALVQLRDAVRALPGYAPPRHLLLALYYVTGSETELDALARSTLAIDPGDAVARAYAAGQPPLQGEGPTPYERGVSLTAAGNDLAAGVAYRRQLRDTPTSADGYLQLGRAQARLGFDTLAVISFQRTLALRPGDTLALRDLARVRGRSPGKARD